MKNAMGIINLVEPTGDMKELTAHRALGAVPIGGRYRLIDFILSNLVNAGVRNVGLVVKDQYRSLMDHLGTGKEWDLDRQRDGLFILPPDQVTASGARGDMDLLYRHLDYLEKSRQNMVIAGGTSLICNIDLDRVLAEHRAMGADITVIYKPDWDKFDDRCTLLHVEPDHRITGIELNPIRPRSRDLSLNICILSKALLIEMLDQSIASAKTDWVKDALMRNLRNLKVYGYPFTGYVGKVTSLRSYYKTSMALLEPHIWHELFPKERPVHTKVKNEPPTRYQESARVSNSLVANGCIIEGTVENSVIFRGVKISKGSVVKDSIVMQKSVIGEGCLLQNVILDKEVVVTAEKNLVGDPDYPMVLGKKTVI
ncbi:MAG: glucose-1-phosphate adenylyltransferase subunit GlgD [Firmicutes bacterium]|nr:glucose-1-phosphate adenylyltransferase subunit GlgD [Bacillota bacterium]